MFDFENLKVRYANGWIRGDQLERYVELGVITREKAQEIKSEFSVIRRYAD